MRESEGDAEVSRSQPLDKEEARESVTLLAAGAEEGLMWRDNTAGSPGRPGQLSVSTGRCYPPCLSLYELEWEVV